MAKRKPATRADTTEPPLGEGGAEGGVPDRDKLVEAAKDATTCRRAALGY